MAQTRLDINQLSVTSFDTTMPLPEQEIKALDSQAWCSPMTGDGWCYFTGYPTNEPLDTLDPDVCLV